MLDPVSLDEVPPPQSTRPAASDWVPTKEPEISAVMTDDGPMVQTVQGTWWGELKIRRSVVSCRAYVANLERAIRAAEAMEIEEEADQ